MNNQFSVIDNFIRKRENEVIENYHIIVSTDAIYLVNSSVNYSEYFKSIFAGVGEIIGLFGDAIGFFGELATEITGSKLSKALKKYSEKNSEKNIQKILKNLDKLSAKKKGITKIEGDDLQEIIVKKGFLINGISSVEFILSNETWKFQSKERSRITELTNALKKQKLSTKITSKFL